MTDQTIIIILVILLISIIVLYWLSNKFGNVKKNITKNNKITKITEVEQEFNVTANDEPLIQNNNYLYNAKYDNLNRTLSIYDIIENVLPEEDVDKDFNKQKNNNLIKPSLEEEKEKSNLEEPLLVDPYPQQIANQIEEVNSFVIGKLEQDTKLTNDEEKEDLELTTEEEVKEPDYQKDEKELSEAEKETSINPLITSAFAIPKLNEVSTKTKDNYINYKPKDNTQIKVDPSVSLNNEKCANFQYDLLPDWLRDLITREKYNILISNDSKLMANKASLFTPMESSEDKYMIFNGESETQLESTFLVTVGHFVDNYLGNLAQAPVDEETNIKFFSANSKEWLEIFKKNKTKLKKENILSPSSYFASVFKDYMVDKEKLKKKDALAFQFMNKCLNLLEFHYQKDIVENNCENLEDYQKQEKQDMVNQTDNNEYEKIAEPVLINYDPYEYDISRGR